MSALSKRQQARNERTLQDLITSVPGNDRCADCQARNPGRSLIFLAAAAAAAVVFSTHANDGTMNRMGKLECKPLISSFAAFGSHV